MKVDVIIPTYKPPQQFQKLMLMLEEQNYPINCIRIINTKSDYFPNEVWEENYPVEIVFIEAEKFDHGGTRNMAAKMSDADIIIFMTQDAIPANKKLVYNLVKTFENNDIDVAYGRQLPFESSDAIEKFTRNFNYPKEAKVKSIEDLQGLGIKTFFCSNVCAAYRRKRFCDLGGFESKTIFNEDMIFAANSILKGGKIAYVPEAVVIHSHNYSGVEQFRRNFDMAVSQEQHAKIFSYVKSEKEGVRLVKETTIHLVRTGHTLLIFKLIWLSFCKLLGYKMGRKYKNLPHWLVKRCTSNTRYWNFKS